MCESSNLHALNYSNLLGTMPIALVSNNNNFLAKYYSDLHTNYGAIDLATNHEICQFIEELPLVKG